MDPDRRGESSQGAFERAEVRTDSDSTATSGRLYQAAYDGLFRRIQAELAWTNSTGDGSRRADVQGNGTTQRLTAQGSHDQSIGALQGQVPDAYLKYLNRYKRENTPAPDFRPGPDKNRDNPAIQKPKPERSDPKGRIESLPEQPDLNKTLPGMRPQIKFLPGFDPDNPIGPWQPAGPNPKPENCNKFG